MRRRHPKKDIEEALRYAETSGWHVRVGGSHRWGHVGCGSGCGTAVWSTPANPGNHAKKIRRIVERCQHVGPMS